MICGSLVTRSCARNESAGAQRLYNGLPHSVRPVRRHTHHADIRASPRLRNHPRAAAYRHAAPNSSSKHPDKVRARYVQRRRAMLCPALTFSAALWLGIGAIFSAGHAVRQSGRTPRPLTFSHGVDLYLLSPAARRPGIQFRLWRTKLHLFNLLRIWVCLGQACFSGESFYQLSVGRAKVLPRTVQEWRVCLSGIGISLDSLARRTSRGDAKRRIMASPPPGSHCQGRGAEAVR